MPTLFRGKDRLMLLQTNSYVVPKEKRAEHARLLNRFRQTLTRLGCDHFEAFEQAGSNWGTGEPSGRYVQLIRFRDKKHHQQVQAAERTDPVAQKLIAEFCELINFPYQQQQGLFAVGFYNSVLPVSPARRVDAGAVAAANEKPVTPPTAEPHPRQDVSPIVEDPATTNGALGHAADVEPEPDTLDIDLDDLDLESADHVDLSDVKFETEDALPESTTTSDDDNVDGGVTSDEDARR
jgi:hypothetical protein